MTTMITFNNSISLMDINCMPQSVSEVYHLGMGLNEHITRSLAGINSSISNAYKETIKNLLYYQQLEKDELIELLHNEAKYCDRAFYDKKKVSISVYDGNGSDSAPITNAFIQKSLDSFCERIDNFVYICHENQELSEADLVILYLGLRDYCANLFQQMAVNYNKKLMMNSCQAMVVMIDQISDDVGLAYTNQKHNNPEGE